ncbi:MAG: alpha/beta hydrolase [Actinophytocola sp.]|nr:alpha/beta hydrolase [Actinophytocola sp.]
MAGFYGQVRDWKSGPLDDAEGELKNLSERLLSLSDEFSQMGAPAGWVGTAAEAATNKRVAVTEGMEQIVASVAAARKALMGASDGILGLSHGIKEADNLARAHGFSIGDDGTVRDVNPPQDVPEDQRDDIRRERERIQAELLDRVEQNLRRAHDIDDDLARVLGTLVCVGADTSEVTGLAAAAALGEDMGASSLLEPPTGNGTPGDNAAWWDSLSPDEQRFVIENHPGWIGNRDGIPFTARDEANQARLETEKDKLLAEAARIRAELDDNLFGGLFTNADARLEQVEEHLAAIDTIEKTLAEPGERQLLLLDFSNPRAEAAIANGNVDTADHVAVFTPGLTSNVPDSMGSYDNDMDYLNQRSVDELDKYGDGGSVATVTWIGYQAPQLSAGSLLSSESVVFDDAAKAGGAKLTSFLQGIDTARDTDAHLTALGHSYGSTTTGFALQQNTGVDEAVFFGSPGIGTGDLDDIQVPDGHATYIEAKNDAVGDFGHFGIDPSHMDGMGHASSSEARHPDDGRLLSEVTGHTSYLNDGSTSQYNMSVIVGGMDRVVEGANRGIGDVGSWPIPGTY